MSSNDKPALLPDQPDGLAKRVLTPVAIFGAVSMTLFVATEIIAFAFATVWAATGLMHLGETATYVVALIVAVPMVWALWLVAKMAWAAETDAENN
jgi:hypothetical protein